MLYMEHAYKDSKLNMNMNVSTQSGESQILNQTLHKYSRIVCVLNSTYGKIQFWQNLA
jgi:hypothetical protein